MKKEMIGDGETRILFDAFEDNVNKKWLNDDGYRRKLYRKWVNWWKPYTYVCRNNDGTLEYDDCEKIFGTWEEFEKYLDELN